MSAADPASRSVATGPQGPVLFWVAAFLLVFAPLVRGGNRPPALLALESAGVLALAALVWWRPKLARVDAASPLAWGVAILIAYPLLQLLPLPLAWWTSLPGRDAYAASLELSGAREGVFHALSLHPRATAYAWLAMIPCLAVFLAVRELDGRDVRRLAIVFVAVAAAEATLGVMQTGAARGSALLLGNEYGVGGATGTYVNRNHLAALLAMALPVLMAFWARQARAVLDRGGQPLREHPRHADRRFAQKVGLAIGVLLLLVALLLTRSRAGIACGMAVFALASIALLWSAASLGARLALLAVGISAAAFAAYIGFTPIVERFSADEVALGLGGRACIAAASLEGALDFLPFGSGLGTFADVFPRYQAERIAGFVDHAHNDYVEALVELGVAGAAAIVLIAIAAAMRWRDLVRASSSPGLRHLQIGAGLGLLAIAAHALFDFNFHIPANAIYASFLAGVFFHEPAE